MLEAETHDSISYTPNLVSLFFFNVRMSKMGLRNVISAGSKENGISSSSEHMKNLCNLRNCDMIEG